MAASQEHGNVLENMVKATFGNAANHRRLTTQHFDIESQFDREKSLPTSIKVSLGNTIYLADARNIFSINEEFRLIILRCRQDGDIKTLYEVVELYPSVEEWNALKGDMPFAEVENFHNHLKTFKLGEHFKARSWVKEHKKNLDKNYHSIISLDAKIDSKTQRRLQCSVSLDKLQQNIKNVKIYTSHYRGMVMPYSIVSDKRTRHEKSEAHKLDQFFTKPHVAKECYETLQKCIAHIEFDCWLEPSAGAGAFYNLLPDNKIGIDIMPQFPEIMPGNFLNYSLEPQKYIAIGNPPFGKNSSLAIQFFNRCAMFCEVIAFIVPKTFKKTSVINKLNNYFHLIEEKDIPAFSFELEGADYDVPCVFQIWQNMGYVRESIENIKTHTDFIFTTKDKANFAIQRVGANAGKLKEDFINYAPASHYFIAASDDVKNIFKSINWASVKYNTAGNPSISKNELIKLYEEKKLK